MLSGMDAAPEQATESTEAYTVVPGDVNTGVRDSRCEALFSAQEGGLASFRRNGESPAICFIPRPSLFRAPTDNDVGNRFAQQTALWRIFCELAVAEQTRVETLDGLLCVHCRYNLPTMTDITMDVRYKALSAAQIQIDATLAGGDNLPPLPAFGLSFRLPRSLRAVRYYGMGSMENEVDRRSGAILDIYHTTVDENLTPYLKPQACGNRTGVRWMEVTDTQGHGLRVSKVDQPLEISVLPHSQLELACALHQEDLPTPAYTYLDIAAARYGVGGDDSWGAPVLAQYRLSADQPLRLSFVLTLL